MEVRSCLELTAVVSLSCRCGRVRGVGECVQVLGHSPTLTPSVSFFAVVYFTFSSSRRSLEIGSFLLSSYFNNMHTRVQPDPIMKAMHHGRSTLVCTHPVHAQRGRPSRLGFDFRARHVGAFCVRVRGARTRTNILYFNEECTQCIPISKRHTVKSKKL